MGKNISNEVFIEWRALLGVGRVLDSKEDLQNYDSSTLGTFSDIVAGVLLPKTVEEVIAIVKIASAHHVPLYPISTGNNWGYGGGRPVSGSCVVLDLSGMNRILSINKELGLVTVEPGVTSGQLRVFLESKEIPFTSPMTGAGPNCSIIGNALEHGRGINAFIDRPSSIRAFDVVLVDGTLYSSVSGNDPNLRGFFKWGIGPHLDGLFGQNNLGIVVSATLALAPAPECTEGFLISIKENKPLSSVVDAMRTTLKKLGTVMPSIQIQNPQRVLTRTTLYSKEHTDTSGTLSDEFVRTALDSLFLTQWTVLGALQGNRQVVKAARGVVKKSFGGLSERTFFFDEGKLRILKFINTHFPLPKRLKGFLLNLPMLRSFLQGTMGRDRSKNSRLLLWKSSENLSSEEKECLRESDFDLDPSCGLIFFPAVLPMIGKNVESFVTSAEEICKKHGIEPVIGLLNFSDTCMYVGLPLLFDKGDTKEASRAWLCYEELSTMISKCGGYLHRANVNSMDKVVNQEGVFWQMAQKIKNALDPDNIISPGRYSL